jgi:hypothetical protein
MFQYPQPQSLLRTFPPYSCVFYRLPLMMQSVFVRSCPDLSEPVLTLSDLVRPLLLYLHSTVHKCYIHTPRMILSTANRYRRSLEKLATESPTTKSSLIWLLLPEIESALASGKKRKEVWQCLTDEGLEISYDTFCRTMHRVRNKQPLSAARSGKSLALSKRHAKDGTNDVPHDPLANLRKVEASRPGFHFRGTESLDFLVYGRRQAHESKR